MDPDYPKMVEEFCKPVFMEIMVVIVLFVVFVGYQLLKENQIYRKKLGKE